MEYMLEAELRVFGYTHKIAIMVNGTVILFEPDEERNYRGILEDPFAEKKADPKLVAAIALALHEALS